MPARAGVGNGGLSLRSVPAMLELSRRHVNHDAQQVRIIGPSCCRWAVVGEVWGVARAVACRLCALMRARAGLDSCCCPAP